MTCATDIDGMLSAFPEHLIAILTSLQSCGWKVGVLSGRPTCEHDQLQTQLTSLGFIPDFIALKPEEETLSNGTWKAEVCNQLAVDVLFDDFQCNDPKMLADFFTTNTKTIPFTSWTLTDSTLTATEDNTTVQ